MISTTNASPRAYRLSAATVLLALLTACSRQEPPAPQPPEVAVVTVRAQSVPIVRQLVGRLSPYRTADVRARVPGVLKERLYLEGSDVNVGQPLFQIDPAPLQAALDRARAEREQAQAVLMNAVAAAERARSLAPSQFISKADLDAALATERSASASVSQAKAAVSSARIDLGYSRVLSPIQGRAGKQQVTEGALVGSADVTLLTTVDQIDQLYVNLSISNAELDALREADRSGALTLAENKDVTVRVLRADGTEYPHRATLDFAAMDVDTSSGSVALRALLPNPDHALLPGSFVTVEANLGSRAGSYLLPQQAVQRDTTGSYVLVASSQGIVSRKDVSIEPRAVEGKWVVTSGLADGDRVIALGVQAARIGAPVKTVAFAEPSQVSGSSGDTGSSSPPSRAPAQN